jgi:hypothetical protein
MGCELGVIQLWAGVRIPPNNESDEAALRHMALYFV